MILSLVQRARFQLAWFYTTAKWIEMNKSFIDSICNGEVLTSIRNVHLLMGGFELLQTSNKFNLTKSKIDKN